MNTIHEAQTLTTIRLSDVQKMVMTKIIGSATPETAHEEISDGRNLVAARNILGKLGLIEFTEGTADVTDEGKKVMKDENLIDDSEELTSDGQVYSQAKDLRDLEDKDREGTAPPEGGAPEDEFGGDELDLGGEEGADKESGEDDRNLDLGESMDSLKLIQEIAKVEATIRKINEMNKKP